MKTIAVAMVVLVCCVGCMRGVSSGPPVVYTNFFNTHNAETYLKSLAEKEKSEFCGGSSSSVSSSSSIGSKDWTLCFKGDEKLRNTFLHDYKDYVENELNKSGVSIYSRSKSEEVSGFSFKYKGHQVGGIIRVNSAMLENGDIQIDVFMYEHGM